MTARPHVPAGWRAFAAPRYRPFHLIAVGQAFVGGLAMDALFIPFLFSLGAPAWLATVIGALPLVGSMLQAANPALLRRVGGNLRGITLLFNLAEMRGLAFAAIAALAAGGAIGAGSAILLVAIVVGVGQTLGLLSSANLALWSAIVLPDGERRLVAPRATVLNLTLSTVLLLPVSAVLDGALHSVGLWAYVGVFLVGGLGGSLVRIGASRLPKPGRVNVSARAEASEELPPAFYRLRRATGFGCLGQGLVPYMSVFVLSVLHLSPGFAVATSAVGSAASLIASAGVASFLHHGSASRVLRLSFGIRTVAPVFAIAAVAFGPLAPAFVLVSVALFNSAGSAGALATNERLFRILPVSSTVAGQSRFVASNQAAVAVGQFAQTGVLAVAGPGSVVAFGLLYAACGVSRGLAALWCDVSASWRSEPRPVTPPVAPETITETVAA